MLGYRTSEDQALAHAWQAVLGRLEVELTSQNFDTWLRETRALRMEETTLVVEAKSAFACDWLNRQLATVVRRAVSHVLESEPEVLFVPRRVDGASAALFAPCAAPAPASTVVGCVKKTHTFESYLRADGNGLAVDRCLSLFDPAGFPMSPIVIYGSPGMGKTHLLHAAALQAANAGWPVACLSAEEFATRYLGSLRRGAIDDFQASVRNVRLFVLDDLQYLAGKKGTLDELVHTIDYVTNTGGHVVIASEQHPADMGLPERLESRLSSGVVTRIEPFGAADRRAFIERRAREARAALPSWAIERIGGLNALSVRALQGAVNNAITLQWGGQLDMRRLDAELTRVAVSEVMGGCPDTEVIETVARHFQLTRDDVTGTSRKPAATAARATAAAALRERGRSNSEVGAVLGNRDRTTIPALAERGQQLLAADPNLRAKLA
ncbi:MAG: ATP-binding protein [Chloroflexi bacterium]|nr:ATP-binding protein [Chloroflexota bacterium]